MGVTNRTLCCWNSITVVLCLYIMFYVLCFSWIEMWKPQVNFGGTINWFPGHMAKASRLIQENLKSVDVVLEIRDARIPLSSRNEKLEVLIHNRNLPHIVVLHKADLADPNLQQVRSVHTLCFSFFDHITHRSLAPTCSNTTKSLSSLSSGKCMCVCGPPNSFY